MKRSSSSEARKLRRIKRVRAKIKGTADRPRLAVRRSLAHMYAQLIDDASGRTIAAARDLELSEADRKGKKKTEVAAAVGRLMAERAKAKGVSVIVFDRRDKQYHGRVQALAEGARTAGLKF